MNKYNGLLSTVAQKYHILKGTHETEDEWKTRLVYSVCGMMAYASLWDNSEDGTISMVHLKKRVQDILENYKSMYPELSGNLPYNTEELEDEIENLFLSTGVVYHCPNRIVASMKHEEAFGNILFQRGIALDSISCVSGIGFYSKREKTENFDRIKAMFGFETETLHSLWDATLSSAVWQSNQLFESNTEYLRIRPPFSQGYWVNKPDTNGAVSILRSGTKGAWFYSLYRYSCGTIEVSPIPQWKVESYNYRLLACACLLSCGTLPPIKYFEDGALVHIHMDYLLPPCELEFLKLYSWPETCTLLPCNFKRKLSAEVFTTIKSILSDKGFLFIGGIL